MSNATYNNLLSQAIQQLESEIDTDIFKRPSVFDPETQNDEKFQKLAEVYVELVLMYQKLQEAVDFLTHPQKRRIARELLYSVMAKLIDTKYCLTKFKTIKKEIILRILKEKSLTPLNLQIQPAQSIVEEFLLKKAAVTQFLYQKDIPIFSKNVAPIKLVHIAKDEAIRMIQIHERARQGKLRALFMEEMKNKSGASQPILSNSVGTVRSSHFAPSSTPLSPESAVVKIQRVARGYLARKLYKKMLNEDLLFLEMTTDQNNHTENESQQKAQQRKFERKVIQVDFEKNYQEALVQIKERLFITEGTKFRDALMDEVREWYMEYRKKYDKFPALPTEAEWCDPNFQFKQWAQAKQKAMEAENEKSKDKNKKPDKKNAPVVEEVLPDMNFITRAKTALEMYKNDFANRNEKLNFEQKHEEDIIIKNKRREMQIEIKDALYPAMIEEMENFQTSIEGSAGKKNKKKEKGTKEKKSKTVAAENAEPFDPVNDSLLQELINMKVIQMPLPSKLIHSYMIDNLGLPFGTSYQYGDLIQLSKELIITTLLMDASTFEGLSGPLSFLFYGLENTGKTSLINDLILLSGATFYNLSAPYISQAGENANKLLTNTFKLAKQTAPSIIFIDDIEWLYSKKPKPDTSFDMRTLKKELQKNIKNLKVGDGVVFIGKSSRPWEADMKTLSSAFDLKLQLKKPTSEERYRLWKEAVLQATNGVPVPVSYDTLAFMSEGVIWKDMVLSSQKVLTKNRLKSKQPIEVVEFLQNIPKKEKNEESTYQEWLIKFLDQ